MLHDLLQNIAPYNSKHLSPGTDSGLAKGFWLRVSPEVAAKLLAVTLV